jgi:hypothetical protein
MSSIAFTRRDISQSIIQRNFQQDEQLLWWNYPQLKNGRHFITRWDIASLSLFSGIVTILFISFIYTRNHIAIKGWLTSWTNGGAIIGFFVFCAFAMYLGVYLRTYTVALKKAPRYWRYTLYAITDQRALILVHLPGHQPKIFEYLPCEIGLPTNVICHDDSGILTFGASHQPKMNSDGQCLALPGQFWGISHIQEATELLWQLRSKSKRLVQDDPDI